MNMNSVIIIITKEFANVAIPLFLVVKPPVDKVEKEMQTASKTGIPSKYEQ